MCGAPAIKRSRCLKHLVKAREQQRKKYGTKRRYRNALSYRLEGKNPLAEQRMKNSTKKPAKR
jgi:hypothetical protein